MGTFLELVGVVLEMLGLWAASQDEEDK
ncbi:hypothetical protein NIGALANA_56 [Bacillus phage Nigalana]|uniref:Uncharacterized protein n=2 Tax=Wphvirus megatron TaxID=1987728 RepID=A0A1B1PBA6_9CAUD|nr:hypothetical protein QLX47_gp057 [Bacillus phage Eyuki]YP_009278071.1 hypothetical protein BI007_gp050 [Bacillus phage DIGNKC]YP_009282448.1 hypothetical protein BI005_gp056 [Bacillus phage Nigalana]YP_009284381.1 hypothetical protein BI004_gp053 [Bacillus phage NotTheCreek]YP_009284997.1 hypothetical protein BIZ88_gp055 [Bacillus phage DirtyBetty]YP_009286931.1 hypothetical protein BI006_gp055 [Bacillus phage Nemo]AOZ61674.1 hypothetical protein BJ4_51 [Bacillus phage BJ4]AXQ67635.1 hypo